MVAKDAVVTLPESPGFGVIRSLGYVTGTAARPHDRLRATFRSLGALIGLAPAEYLSDAEHAREDALDGLRRQAGELGANAVINLQFQATEGLDGSTRVVAYGEAVVLGSEQEREEPAAISFSS